jgi:integrase
VFGSPKTHETRTVIVPRFVVDRLKPLLEGKDPEDLVFTAPQGGVWRGPNFRRRVFSPAAVAAGLPKDLVPHDLRDTAASLMIASGASIKAVQRALGHASAKVTLDVYGSLYEEDLEALADRMEERFAEDDVAPKLPDVG